MSLRARTDALIAAVDIRRTTTIKGDVRALAAALGVPFNGVATTLAALEAECLAAPAPAPAPAPAASDLLSVGVAEKILSAAQQTLPDSLTDTQRTQVKAALANVLVDFIDVNLAALLADATPGHAQLRWAALREAAKHADDIADVDAAMQAAARACVVAARDGDTSWQKPHFGPIFAAAWSGVPQADEALAGIVMDPSQPGIVRASALQALAAAPLRARLPVAAQALAEDDPLIRLAALSCFEGTERNVLDQVVGTMRQDPVRAVRVEAARLLAEADAHAELLESFDATAERPETWLNRGLFELARGEVAAAEAAYQRALAFEPRFVGAAVNLADLYRSQGREDDGRKVLEALIAAEPQAAAAHHALGLLLVRQGQRAAALSALEKAARFAPEDPRFAFVHAVALHDDGQAGVAASVLENALMRHPGDFDLRSFYANLLLEQGEKQAARVQAETLQRLFPQDRRVEALLRATQQ